ncbi:glycosyl hydrolase [Nocardioides sp. YIM 152588]|uniref:glycosyl hydrolase n=1 Tax=Nocardioides sp. YIM 152588 TaxID=3158259 RepID=UPI0032E45557
MEDDEIRAEVAAMAESGAGGIEVAPFPGDSSSDEYLDEYGFGTPRWNHVVEVIQDAGAEHGLTVDWTVSPGWPGSKVTAGQTTPEDINDPAVSKQLLYGREVVAADSGRSGAIPTITTPSVLSTTLCAPAAAGDTTLQVASVGTVAIGNVVTVGDVEAEVTAIGTAGTCATLTVTPLPGAAPPGAAVTSAADEALVAVVAAQCTSACTDSGTAELDPDSVVDLTGEVEGGTLEHDFPAGNGNPWQLLAFYYTADVKTGSNSASSPTYVVDHLGREGAEAYRDFWTSNAFGNNPDGGFNSTATQRDVDRVGGGALFTDSLELSSNIKWTPRMLEQWQRLRGYDATLVLPALAGIGRQGLSQGPFVFGDGLDARIRHDYRQTWSDLFISEHLEVMKEYGADINMETRVQAYGDPIVVPSAMAHVDQPEAECNMGFPEVGKFIAVGAHMQEGRTLVSSENCAIRSVWDTKLGGNVGAGGQGPGATPAPNLSAAYRTFAGGVTQHVWHGFGYITTDAQNGTEKVWPWHAGFNHNRPGWGETWNPVMPTWQAGDMREVNDDLARHSLVLRQGSPRFDVAIYWQGHGIGSNGGTVPSPDSRVSSTGPLAQRGYTNEYITDEFLNDPQYGAEYEPGATLNDGAFFPTKSAYKALILNGQETLDLVSARKILSLAEDGLPVIVVGDLPTETPGARDHEAADAALIEVMAELDALSVSTEHHVRRVGAVADAVAALEDLGIEPAASREPVTGDADDSAIISVRRHTDDADYYLLFNQTNEEVTQRITLDGDGTPYLLNTWTGETEPLASYDQENGRVTVDVRLMGQDTTVIAVSTRNLDRQPAPAVHVALQEEGDTHSFRYVEGGQLLVTGPNGRVEGIELSDGRTVSADLAADDEALSLDRWDLEVESFTGDETGLPGIEHTLRTRLSVGEVADTGNGLPAWSEIHPDNGYAVDLRDVSGIGYYTTTVDLRQGWHQGQGALLDLGSATDSSSVTVNGKDLPPIDLQDIRHIDVGPYLKKGSNTIEVRVATTLINAVRVAPGTGAESRARDDDYGLTGPVSLELYATEVIKRGPVSSVRP